MSRKIPCVVAAALLASIGSAVSVAGEIEKQAAQAELLNAYPGVRVYEDGPRDRVFYGQKMTTAATPQAAIEGWLETHGGVFGVGELEHAEHWSGDVNFGRFWVYMFQQELDGLPVELSPGRVLARHNDDGTWSVVYAAGVFAAQPEGGFAPMTRTAQDAVNTMRGSGQFRHLPVWSGAELVAWQSESSAEAARAWKFVGENPDLVNREKYTFFVDASTGALLEARDDVHNIDVFGFVRGMGSPGTRPDDVTNPPEMLDVNDIRVQISGGNDAYTDVDGFFDISHGGTTDVTITADFDFGRWCNINDQSGTAVQEVSGIATPGTEALLEFNTTPSALRTAQVNAFIHTGLIHNFIADRTSWTGMDFVCRTNVNIASSCNAFFDGGSINFYRAGGGCPNTAYSSVVAHEYGHYIVSRLALSQGSFGEGYGDTCGEMLYDTGLVGEGFFGPGSVLRNNEDTYRQYPCSGPIHSCGQALGGVWRHLRLQFGNTYGSQTGLELTQQLFVDWSVITTGGSGNDAAHPGTAIEVLTLDDDDGNLDNGTPNYGEIEIAFELHGIDVPDIIPLNFDYPVGRPDTVSPAGGTSFDVVVTGNAGFTPEPGTGVLHINTGDGYAEYPMTEVTDNVYIAEFPAIDCRTDIEYYVSAMSVEGARGKDPIRAPLESFSAYAAESRTLIVEADFETDVGFTVENDNVTAGAWSRSVPRNRPPADYDGSGKAYVTGVGVGNPDLDGGPTRLISPVYDMTGLNDPYIGYARWFYNDDPQEDVDRLTVELSNDGGTTWVTLEDLADQGQEWAYVEHRVRDYVALTDQTVLRFSAIDAGQDSEFEAGIDALLIDDVVCDDSCYADFNGDGTVNTQDVLSYLNAWNASDASADCNGDGSVNTQDVLCYLNAWNTGC